MTAPETNALRDFDTLWNFNKPAETETAFRELLPVAQNTGDPDLLLQLLTQIARTQGLQRKFEEAHATLDEVQKKLSSQTATAEVRYFLERGRVFNSSKKPDSARPLFEQAFVLADSRGLHNLAVDAAHMVAIAEPESKRQLEWNLKALAIAEQASDEKARAWLGSLYNNIGWTYHGAENFAEALAMFQKALAFREAKGQAPTIRVAKWCVARTYRSLQRFEDALAIQHSLEKEFAEAQEKDGYVFEELGELYLALSSNPQSREYFSLAYEELSKNEWFKESETKRLQRLKQLGG